jgi:hypothetical protein
MPATLKACNCITLETAEIISLQKNHLSQCLSLSIFTLYILIKFPGLQFDIPDFSPECKFCGQLPFVTHSFTHSKQNHISQTRILSGLQSTQLVILCVSGKLGVKGRVSTIINHQNQCNIFVSNICNIQCSSKPPNPVVLNRGII